MTVNTCLRVTALCLLVSALLTTIGTSPSNADPVDVSSLTDNQTKLVEEHVFGGVPSTENIYIRNGYVLCFNPTTKTPNWVAYHVKPEYRQTPPRKGKWKSFRNDPDIDGEATDNDYKGLFTTYGFARGHLAPYAVMGGDRDADGKLAQDDEDDALTVFQSNYMRQHCSSASQRLQRPAGSLVETGAVGPRRARQEAEKGGVGFCRLHLWPW